MKLILIFPRMIHASGDPPLGIGSIAAYVKKHTDAEVSILDTTFHPSYEYVYKKLKREKPDAIGIYVDTIMHNNAFKIAQIAKKLGIFVITGGPHTTVMPETMQKFSDMIVIGEGEITIKEVIQNFEKKRFNSIKGIWYKKNKTWFKNPAREPIHNLDSLEFPALDLMEMENYIQIWHSLDSFDPSLRGTNIIASRGCPYNCSYCQPNLKAIFGEKFRSRSPEHVVAELKELKNKFKIDAFFLHDDTFNISKVWVNKFCDLLDKEKINLLWSCNSRVNTLTDKKMVQRMYDSGLRMIHIGVESGSQRILNEIYRKGIKLSDVPIVIDQANKIGIKTLAFFMLGAPTETIKEIKQTINFAVSLNATEITASITNPLPGTKLLDVMKDKYKISKNFGDFDYYTKRAFEDPDLSYKQLKKYQKILLFRFYTHPKRWGYILKHFTSIKGLKKMWLKVKRFL